MATDAPHDCNGYCRPPEHCELVYSTAAHDVAPSAAAWDVRIDCYALGLEFVRLEPAWEAPPPEEGAYIELGTGRDIPGAVHGWLLTFRAPHFEEDSAAGAPCPKHPDYPKGPRS